MKGGDDDDDRVVGSNPMNKDKGLELGAVVNQPTGTEASKERSGVFNMWTADFNGKELMNTNPEGFSDNVNENCETPEEALRRILFPGEEITAQFDCYFPTKMLPLWKIVTLLIFTAGLYGFVLLYRVIQRWCYRNNCCTPPLVEIVRGRMGVTNCGRVICWAQEARQEKLEDGCCRKTLHCWLKACFCCCPCLPCIIAYFCRCDVCKAPTKYEILTITRVYNISYVRQISQYYASKPACFLFWCCCIEYDAGVEITFREFNHVNDDANVAVSTHSKSQFYSGVIEMMGNVIQTAERTVGAASTDNTLCIVSSTYDRYHNGDVDTVLEELARLHSKVLDTLPEMPDVFFRSDEYSALASSYKKVNKFKGVTIVSDNDKCSLEVPEDWFPLMKGEEILAVHGDVFKLSCWDWVKSIYSFSLYYWCCLKKRKNWRSALILTNKRLVSMDINQGAGQIPENLSKFSVKVSSLLPGSVRAGYYVCEDGRKPCDLCFDWCEYPGKLRVGLNTDGGLIEITLNRGMPCLPFVKALQMSCLRKSGKIESVGPYFTEKLVALTTIEKDSLPTLPDEKILDVIKGQPVFQPFCFLPYIEFKSSICNPCSWKIRYGSPMCSKEGISFLFPIVPWILSCCLRPFTRNEHIFFSDTTIFFYATEGNFGICGCDITKVGPCRTQDTFSVAWAPIISMEGHNFQIKSSGAENCWRRLCRGNMCGRILCPISRNEFELDADLGPYTYSVKGLKSNHNFSKDPEILRGLSGLSRVQLQVEEWGKTKTYGDRNRYNA